MRDCHLVKLTSAHAQSAVLRHCLHIDCRSTCKILGIISESDDCLGSLRRSCARERLHICEFLLVHKIGGVDGISWMNKTPPTFINDLIKSHSSRSPQTFLCHRAKMNMGLVYLGNLLFLVLLALLLALVHSLLIVASN